MIQKYYSKWKFKKCFHNILHCRYCQHFILLPTIVFNQLQRIKRVCISINCLTYILCEFFHPRWYCLHILQRGHCKHNVLQQRRQRLHSSRTLIHDHRQKPRPRRYLIYLEWSSNLLLVPIPEIHMLYFKIILFHNSFPCLYRFTIFI